MRHSVTKAKCIVIKIGTSSLTYSNGRINLNKIDQLSRVISDIKNSGLKVILISSGAIGAGMDRIGLKEKPKELQLKQATAAVGQAILMQFYQKFFGEYNQAIAQILLTKDVFTNEIKKRNAQNTFSSLIDLNVIPIVNENDSVSTDEIHGDRFGDNDTLSAMVAKLVGANLLIILSDINGLYRENPKDNPDAELINCVEHIDKEIFDMAGGSGSIFGTGGMMTKIKAAQIACDSHIDTVIASSEEVRVIYDILKGKNIGTWFKGKNNNAS